MNCWMFPGQPLRPEASFPDNGDGAAIAGLCHSATGLDLYSLDGITERPDRHVGLQVYGTAASLYHVRQQRTAGDVPDMLIEHSMGIYAALAACGAISEHDALEITARVGMTLVAMSARTEYALGCIVGLDRARTDAAAANHGVFVANYNTSSHFLLAGAKTAITSALEECAATGAFSVSIFECDAPLHTPLIHDVADALHAIFADYTFLAPALPLLNHIDQTALSAAATPGFLLEELLRPVWWERSYRAARALGASRFVELGTGNALRKFNRWIDSEAP